MVSYCAGCGEKYPYWEPSVVAPVRCPKTEDMEILLTYDQAKKRGMEVTA